MVHPAIVIDIAECGAAAGYRGSDPRIGALEAAIVIEREQRRLFVMQHVINLLDIVQHVALRDEQILPAIVVEILEANAPAGAGSREQAQAGLQTAIAERAVAVVVKERINLAR